ncbi:MAG: DUF2442 domain-containing protein [Chloroflexia bacterium]
MVDGRYIRVPISEYCRLMEATFEQRLNYEISSHGITIHWEEIDEDLSVSGLLRDFGARTVAYA